MRCATECYMSTSTECYICDISLYSMHGIISIVYMCMVCYNVWLYVSRYSSIDYKYSLYVMYL